MDPVQVVCDYKPGQPYQSLIEVLRDVEVVDDDPRSRYCCWQDVIDAIDAARVQDNAKADKSFVRARLRKSGPEIAMLDSLTSMIPDQDGLSILRGGLTTLFKMVSLRLEIRAMILRAFEAIPEIFMDAVEAGMRFPNAPDLLHAVRQLYDTLVENTAVLIRILLRSHPHKNKLVRFWKQLPGREAEVVRSCLDEVSRATERVRQCSRAALERTVGEIQCTVLASTSLLSADVKAVKCGVEAIPAAIADGVTRLESRHEKQFQMVEESNRRIVEVADQILKDIQGQKNDLGWYQQQYLRLHGPQQQLALPWVQVATITTPRLLAATHLAQTEPMPYEPLSPPISPGRVVSHDDLVQMLEVPECAAAEALARVARRSCHLRVEAGRRSNRLMTMKRFRNWLGAAAWASDLVLVDGHCGNAAADKVSPVSAICASLAEVIMNAQASSGHDRPAAIILYHFCGQHIAVRDPLRGPEGLIRSLVQQLLAGTIDVNDGSAGQALSSGFVDDELLSGVNERDIPSLCRFFCELIFRSSPTRPIFCIIDGVSEMETVLDGWRDDFCIIISTLLDLVDHVRVGPALKVLLASSTRSTELAESVIPADRLVSLLAADAVGKQSYYPTLFERDVDELLMVGEPEVAFSQTMSTTGNGLERQILTRGE